MKKLFQGVLIFSALMLIFAACRQAPRTDEDTRVGDEIEVFDPASISDEVVEIIDKAPRSVDVFAFLNRTGAAYIFDLAVPFDVAEMHESSSQLSLLAGAYAANFAYARAYNRMDVAAQTGEMFINMLNRLGIVGELEESMRLINQMRETDDDDLRNELMPKVIEQLHEEMSDVYMSDIYALTFIGANIEALYIYTQLSLYARDKQAMIDFFVEREDMLFRAYDLLKLLSQEGFLRIHPRIADYHEAMSEIVSYYNAQDEISDAELEVIAEMIEQLRNDMLAV